MTARVIVLGSGTSTGVPVIGCPCEICTSGDPALHRSRSSIAVQDVATGYTVVIDTTPDFRTQMLANGIHRVDAVLYTHTHADHCHGFDDLRAFYFKSKTAMPCYLDAEHGRELRERFSYAFEETGYQGTAPQVDIREVGNSPFTLGPFTIEPVRLPHGAVTTLGFRFGAFAYATDFKSFPSEVVKSWWGNIKTMIASGLHFEQHTTHSNIHETLSLFEELEIEQGYITHLSHRVDPRRDAGRLPKHVSFAYDGQVIAVQL